MIISREDKDVLRNWKAAIIKIYVTYIHYVDISCTF